MPESLLHLRPFRTLSLSLGLVLAATLSPAAASDWPHFRGPSLDGTTPAPAFANSRALEFEEVWRRELGSGYSAVVVVGSTGVTAATRGDRDVLVAFDVSDGTEIWHHDLGPSFRGFNGSDDGPIATPTVHGGRVVLLHPTGNLVSVDLETGKLLWARHLVDDFGAEKPPYGFSSIALLTDGLVVVQAGGEEAPFLVALDEDAGETRWSAGQDRMEHQNPMLWDGPGGRQAVAVGRGSIAGYRLSDGDVLWRHELEGRGHAGDLVVVDDTRILMHRYGLDSMLFEIEPREGRLEARVVWATNQLDHTYAVPLVHEGHVYGFDGGFLVCLDLATGERRWKSRQPGGQQLSLIGDNLVVLANDGALVAAAADPSGYLEVGRIPLFRRRQVLTPVTYAADLFFARDLQELVVLRARPTQMAAQDSRETTDALPAVLEPLVDENASSDSLSFPLVKDGVAYFVWEGEKEDIAIVGDMTGGYEEQALRPVPGADLSWISFEIPEGERWEYLFKVFEEERLDPLNPSTVATPAGERSVLDVGDTNAAELEPCEACPRGTLEAVEIESGSEAPAYRLQIYDPPVNPGEGSLPLVLFTNGPQAIEFGRVVEILDSMIDRGEISPVIAVFLDLPESVYYSRNRSRLFEILDQKILPWITSHRAVSDDLEQRAIVAQIWSVESSLLWALESGGVGKVAAQSPAFGELNLDRDIAPLLDKDDKLEVWLDRGTSDLRNPHWGLDVAVQTTRLQELLQDANHEVHSVVTPGGANWTRWRGQIPEMLRTFLAAGRSEDCLQPAVSRRADRDSGDGHARVGRLPSRIQPVAPVSSPNAEGALPFPLPKRRASAIVPVSCF